MNINSYTLALVYYMAALGVASLSLVETIEAPFVALIAGVCVLSLYFNVKKRVIIAHLLWNVLAVFIFLYFIVDYLYISESLIVAGSRFLAILMSFKLFDVKTNRDYLLAFALVFFQMLAAAASTVNIAFFAILFLFVLGGIWALILFNLKRDWTNANPEAEVMPVRVFSGAFFAFIFAAAISSILISLAVFFIMPRVELGFFQRKTANTLKTSGFSENVDLKELGDLKLDPTVVMRVEFRTEGAPKKIMRFRGSALDRYDGRGWHNSFKSKGQRVLPMDSLRRFIVMPRTPGTVEQNILLEPLDTEVLFAASDPVSIEGRFTTLRIDAANVIYLPAVPHSRIEYTATSSLNGFYEKHEPDPSPYLDTEALRQDPAWPRIVELSKKITGGLKSNRQRARAIENYLRSNYAYNLKPAPTPGKSPIEDFLFFNKEGYCEHFASAMITLLRASGIPGRIVTGFLNGDWNSYGNYMIVRQANAHSWVEVYLEKSFGEEREGWLTSDPTPSAGIGVELKPSTFELYMDLIRWKWNKNIVQYNFAQQRQLARTLEGGTFGFLRGFKDFFKRSPGQPRTIATRATTFIAALILLTGLLIAAYIFRRSKSGSKTPAYYLEMQKTLEKKGFTRNPHETPLEFAERIDNAVVSRITGIYLNERYGTAPPLKDAALKEVMEKIKALRNELKDRGKMGE